MKTNQTTLDQYNHLMLALNVVSKIECDHEAEMDGRAPNSKVTRYSFWKIADSVFDVLIRNLFPRATVEQRNTLLEVMTLEQLMEHVPAEGMLNRQQQDIQNAYEAIKAKVRYLFPLDEQTAMQRHYLETVLLK